MSQQRLPLSELSYDRRRLSLIIYRMILDQWAFRESPNDLFHRLAVHLKIESIDEKDILELMDAIPEQAAGFIIQIPNEFHWALIYEFLLVSIANGEFDSRVRRACKKLCELSENVDWTRDYLAQESRLSQHLREEMLLHDKESHLKQSQSNYKWLKVASAAVVGGVLVGITGGVAAPAALAALGVVGASTAATATIGSIFGVAGASLTSYNVHYRLNGLDEFHFARLKLKRILQQPIENNQKLIENNNDINNNESNIDDNNNDNNNDDNNNVEIIKNEEKNVNNEEIEENEMIKEKINNEIIDINDNNINNDDDDISTIEAIENEHSNVISDTTTTTITTETTIDESSNSIQFEEESDAMHVWLCVSGILQDYYDERKSSPQRKDSFERQWQTALRNVDVHGELYTLEWESEKLHTLGAALDHFLHTQAATQAVSIMAVSVSAVMAAVSFPLSIMGAASLISNPWSMAIDRADKAGSILAQCLLNRAQGKRPVTLIAYSTGARMVFQCLLELSKYEEKGKGIVYDVLLLGMPLSPSSNQWDLVKSVVANRLVNAYSTRDWLLSLLMRSSFNLTSIAGVSPVQLDGVEDVNLSNIVGKHIHYRDKLNEICKILKIANE